MGVLGEPRSRGGGAAVGSVRVVGARIDRRRDVVRQGRPRHRADPAVHSGAGRHRRGGARGAARARPGAQPRGQGHEAGEQHERGEAGRHQKPGEPAVEGDLDEDEVVGVNPAKVGLAIALTLRFIPVLAAIAAEVREAQRSLESLVRGEGGRPSVPSGS
jgi:hypothetical protein